MNNYGEEVEVEHEEEVEMSKTAESENKEGKVQGIEASDHKASGNLINSVLYWKERVQIYELLDMYVLVQLHTISDIFSFRNVVHIQESCEIHGI